VFSTLRMVKLNKAGTAERRMSILHMNQGVKINSGSTDILLSLLNILTQLLT